MRILEQIYGGQSSKLLQNLDDLYPGLGHRITKDAYGHIMNPAGLSLPERELADIVILYAHGFGRQLYSHLRGARRVGSSEKTLKSVIMLTANITGRSPKETLHAFGNISSD